MMSSDAIHIILTGGTINKVYNPLTEKPEIAGAEIVPDYLRKTIQPHGRLTFETLCLKDSLELTEEDRARLVGAVLKSETNRIVIIHGTSTMPVTAAYLDSQGAGAKKCVILTGAMIPLKEFAMSDAGFNLGYALAQVQMQGDGVYVCMNARCFPAGSVTKNTQTGRFESCPHRP